MKRENGGRKEMARVRRCAEGGVGRLASGWRH